MWKDDLYTPGSGGFYRHTFQVEVQGAQIDCIPESVASLDKNRSDVGGTTVAIRTSLS